jgi:hypothetical protein
MAGIHEGIDMFIVFSDVDVTESGFASPSDLNEYFGPSIGSLSSHSGYSNMRSVSSTFDRPPSSRSEVFIEQCLNDIS